MPHDGNFNDFSVNLKDFLQRSFSRLPGKATNKELDRSREREREERERERRGEERRETKKDKGGQYTTFLLSRAFAHAAKKKQKR